MGTSHFLSSDLIDKHTRERELYDYLGFGGVTVTEDEPMSKHTTFRVGGPAELYIEPTEDQIEGIVGELRSRSIPFTVIGNGSNILVSDAGIKGVVLCYGKAADTSIVDEYDMTITAGAGILLSKLAAMAAEAGMSGLEFAAGIPGTLGGALIMNAGAYGGEMKDVVSWVRVINAEGEMVNLTPEQADFGYRSSSMMYNHDIITSARVQLEPGNPEEIKARMAELAAARREKQPLELPSAGSTFKRPEGHFAGKLIQEAGLAGFSIGGAMVSPKHCGFVVNTGNATAADIYNLIQHVSNVVEIKTGVKLEPEVKLLGDF